MMRKNCGDWILPRYFDEGSSGLSRNSPVRTSEEPKRASEVEIAESALGTLQRQVRPKVDDLRQSSSQRYFEMMVEPLHQVIPRNLKR